jgi:hypothetical protein
VCLVAVVVSDCMSCTVIVQRTIGVGRSDFIIIYLVASHWFDGLIDRHVMH